MNNKTFGLPSPTAPASDPKSGKWTSSWYQWVARISQLSAERPIAPIAVGASPFVYEAFTIGNIFITGGSVSAIVLTRGNVSLTCPSGIFIPVAADDVVTVTYSGLPTMTFVPSARA